MYNIDCYGKMANGINFPFVSSNDAAHFMCWSANLRGRMDACGRGGTDLGKVSGMQLWFCSTSKTSSYDEEGTVWTAFNMWANKKGQTDSLRHIGHQRGFLFTHILCGPHCTCFIVAGGLWGDTKSRLRVRDYAQVCRDGDYKAQNIPPPVAPPCLLRHYIPSV